MSKQTGEFISTKAAVIYAMKRVIEAYSEETWAAGWYSEVEHLLYEDSLIRSTGLEAACLRELGDLIGGWIYWDKDEREALFEPWSMWNRRHRAWKKRQAAARARMEASTS